MTQRKNKQQDKLDKRAAKLRENLKRRKVASAPKTKDNNKEEK